MFAQKQHYAKQNKKALTDELIVLLYWQKGTKISGCSLKRHRNRAHKHIIRELYCTDRPKHLHEQYSDNRLPLTQ